MKLNHVVDFIIIYYLAITITLFSC